jgi:DNA-3-methyladenine glycosylase
MFGPPGIAYVYLVYGMYDCLNVVTEPEGRPAAVLIRAVEPLEGENAIRRSRLEWAFRRARVAPSSTNAPAIHARIAAIPAMRLLRGPGLVAAGFGLSRADTGVDLIDPASPVRIEPSIDGDREPRVQATARVGIGYAADPWRTQPWRFFDATSPAVSAAR